MILNDEEINKRLNSDDNLVKLLENRLNGVLVKETLKHGGRGRLESETQIPSRVQELLGRLGNTNDSCREVAAAFDVGKTLVNRLSNGLRSDNSLDKELYNKVRNKDAIQVEMDKAHDEALDLMVSCIGEIKGRIKEVSKPEKLSKVAADMSRIIGTMRGLNGDEINNGPKQQIIVYAPQIKQESEYETIDA